LYASFRSCWPFGNFSFFTGNTPSFPNMIKDSMPGGGENMYYCGNFGRKSLTYTK
jgi:hypothetical protein